MLNIYVTYMQTPLPDLYFCACGFFTIKQILATSFSFPLNPDCCSSKYAKLLVISTGLQSEHLPPPEVEWPSAGVQQIPRLLPGLGPVHAGLHMEAWPFLCQREGSQLPWCHHWQQAAADLQGWDCPVQHQVSRHWQATTRGSALELNQFLSRQLKCSSTVIPRLMFRPVMLQRWQES